MSYIDPFESHPENPSMSKQRENGKLTIGDLEKIIQSISDNMFESPTKVWGMSKTDVEQLLLRVVIEAEKVVL